MRKRNEIGVVFGRKGSGKTWWAREYVNAYKGPVIVWDSAIDFAGPTCERPVKRARVFFSVEEALEEARTGKLGKAPRVVIQARRGESGSAQFDRCCAWARRAGNLLLVVDEVDLFCSPSRIPDALSDCVSLGRHACLDLLFLARRPAEVHRELTSQADWIRAFHTTEPRDLAYLEQACGREFVESLKKLPKYGSAVTSDR